jgi:hypothetical protein
MQPLGTGSRVCSASACRCDRGACSHAAVPVGLTAALLPLLPPPLPLPNTQYMNRKNATKTILWPQPEAWNNFKLGDHLPGRMLDTLDKRTRALRVLAMYRWARRRRRRAAAVAGGDGCDGPCSRPECGGR